jgi:hypothetical protein
MAKLETRIGERSGRLLIVGVGVANDKGVRRLECVCDCGNRTTILRCGIGRTKSCGCLRREIDAAGEWNTTHGMTRKGLYNIWRGIKDRVLNPNANAYKHYGGRGIGFHDEWSKDFSKFNAYILSVLGDRPAGASLDRIDLDRGYEPGNLRWLDQKGQTRNTKRNINITAFGKTQVAMDWAVELGIPHSRIYYRIKHGWDPVDAITRPSMNGDYHLPPPPYHPQP